MRGGTCGIFMQVIDGMGSAQLQLGEESASGVGVGQGGEGSGQAPQEAIAGGLSGDDEHQDGSRHQWVPGAYGDLIVTMDDATNEHYSMFFVDEEGTASIFQGIREVIVARGLFCSLYTDRGSHYWHTGQTGARWTRVS